jgi:uncharacterized integral membrane protein
MPWRLIQFIVLFAILLLFIVFNLENKCDISFGFTVLKDFPVYLTAFIAFIVGMLFALPFIFGFKARKKEKSVRGKGLLATASNKRGKDSSEKFLDSNFPDKSHYGID